MPGSGVVESEYVAAEVAYPAAAAVAAEPVNDAGGRTSLREEDVAADGVVLQRGVPDDGVGEAGMRSPVLGGLRGHLLRADRGVGLALLVLECAVLGGEVEGLLADRVGLLELAD